VGSNIRDDDDAWKRLTPSEDKLEDGKCGERFKDPVLAV
jgi:hypothetical protein